MKNNEYNRFFESVAPDKELTERTLKQMKKAYVKPVKAMPKKLSAALIAGCAVLVCGVSAAALGEMIGFRPLFGNKIITDDTVLADSLMGTVSDVSCSVSDEDYRIEVKGAAGDKNTLMLIAELSRKDGTPVTEHFLNPTDEKKLAVFWDNIEIAGQNSYCSGGSLDEYITENGNIGLAIDFNYSCDISGKTIKYSGINLYPNDAYCTTMFNSGVFNRKYGSEKGYFILDKDGILTYDPAEFDDSGLKLLDLEWELSFRFEPSEASVTKLECVSPAESAVYYQDVYDNTVTLRDSGNKTAKADENTLRTVANNVYVERIEVGSMTGKIKISWQKNEYESTAFHEDDMTYTIMTSSRNELYLIRSDGTHIPAKLELCSGTFINDTAEIEFSIIFTDENGQRIIADISDVTSICFNGTVYNLS